MANYVVKLYNQTGFDTCNVPDSPRMIESNFTPYKTYDTFELVQGRYLATLRVQLTAREANKIDLITVSSEIIYDTTVYIVDHYEMKAPDVCEFHLLVEPYSTLGGFGYDSGNNVLNGSLKRCHVSVEDDNKNFYTLPEPFENNEPIEWTVTRLTTPSNPITLIETLSVPSRILVSDSFATLVKNNDIDVCAMSDSNVSREGAFIAPFVGYDDKNKASYVLQYMETPVARELVPTYLRTIAGTNINLGVRWWDASKVNYAIPEVKKVVKKQVENITVKGSLTSDLVSDGRAGDVTAIWEIPENCAKLAAADNKDYNPTVDEDYGGIAQIYENTQSGNINLTKWATTTYNNKLNYGQNLMVKIFNPASGSTIEHQVTEIMAPGSAAEWISSVPYEILYDIRPTGCPVFMFRYLNKADNFTSMIETIEGGKWRQVNLQDTGTASKLDTIQTRFQNDLRFIDNMSALFNGLMGVLENKTTLDYADKVKQTPAVERMDEMAQIGIISNVGNAALNIWRNNTVTQQQNKLLSARAATASVNLNREATNFATDLDKNAFFSIVSHFSNHDLQNFDIFLTRYGYNVGSMPFEEMQTAFYNRPAYNFVQVNDMTVESVTGNINLVNDAVDRLKQGLRIWHVKPNGKDLLAGGNR